MKTAFLLTFLLFYPNLEASDLDSVLRQHYKAMGGIHELEALKSLEADGQVLMRSMTVPFRLLVKNGKYRLELHIADTSTVKIYDGHKGWEINPLLGSARPRPMVVRDTREVLGFWDQLGFALVDDRQLWPGDHKPHKLVSFYCADLRNTVLVPIQ